MGVLASSRDPSLRFAVIRTADAQLGICTTADLKFGSRFSQPAANRYLQVQGAQGTGGTEGGRSNPAPCGPWDSGKAAPRDY